jgi:hypothetical protein
MWRGVLGFLLPIIEGGSRTGMLDKDDATLDELELLVLAEIEDEAEREKAVASIRALRDLLAMTSW